MCEMEGIMNRFEWLEINGKIILRQDFSHLKNVELMNFFNTSHDVIKDRGEKNIIVVTNMDDVIFDEHAAKQFCKLLEVNKPYVSASAIYNACNVQKMALESAASVTNRDFLIFFDKRSVDKWLDSL